MKEINISINISLTVGEGVQPIEIEESIRKLLNLSQQFNAGDAQSESNPKLADYMKANLQDGDLKPSTVQNRLSTIAWVERLFPDLRVKQMKTEFIKQFSSTLRDQGLSVNTTVKHIAHLRMFLLKAARKGVIDNCWLDTSLYSLKRTPFKHSFLSKSELEQLENIDFHQLRDVSRMIVNAFLFCCYTGLRFSDVTQLKFRHLERYDDECWINIRMRKTGNPIRIPLSKLFGGKGMHLVDTRNKLPHTEDTRLFPIKSNEYANLVLKKVFRRLHVTKHVTFHTSRHTFATLCLSSGVKLEVIQALLGHHSIKTTQIYATMTNHMVTEALKHITW